MDRQLAEQLPERTEGAPESSCAHLREDLLAIALFQMRIELLLKDSLAHQLFHQLHTKPQRLRIHRLSASGIQVFKLFQHCLAVFLSESL